MENKKEKNKDGKITLEKLARMVLERVDESKVEIKHEMNTRFDKVEIRLGSVEERLDRVEHKLSKVDYRVEEVYDILVSEEKQVLDLQKRVGTLEKAVQKGRL